MTKEELEAIERRAEAATPGPWRIRGDQFDCPMVISGDGREVADTHGLGCTDEPAGNAFFIAAARSDVPALCARVRELEAMCATEAGLTEAMASRLSAERDAALARVRELEAELGLEKHVRRSNFSDALKFESLADEFFARATAAETALREARAELEVLREVAEATPKKKTGCICHVMGGERCWVCRLHDALGRWDEFKKGRG